MPDRFDNLSLEELNERQHEMRVELDAVREALKARLLAECLVRVGFIYRFVEDHLQYGKEFLVCSLRPDGGWWQTPDEFRCYVHGFLSTKKSTASDGFGRQAKVLRDWTSLDIESGRLGPRKFYGMLEDES